MDKALKQKEYVLLTAQMKELFSCTQNRLSNMANAAAALYFSLSDVSWAGFYLAGEKEMTLGCFCGKPACVTIPFGKGVCGRAAQTRQSVVVANVRAFEGHIACDASSSSEIVLPLIKKGKLLGVLDMDSYRLNRFDEADEQHLRAICELIVENCF
jgi:GAF domain-containing protein